MARITRLVSSKDWIDEANTISHPMQYVLLVQVTSMSSF